MSQVIEAIYEAGTFRPLEVIDLQEGQHVALTVEPMAMTREEAKQELQAWHAVYEGLSDQDVAEVERIALERGHVSRDSEDDSSQP